jgi:type II secretory pathway pseudopilin PulG
MTLVEVMVSVFLVAVAAAIIYTEMIISYRILMRSRAKLEANSMAFDAIWEAYNMSWTELKNDYSVYPGPIITATHANSVLSTNGYIKLIIRPENDLPTAPELINYWDMFVEVWPAMPDVNGKRGSLQIGTNSLASYQIRRYQGER